MLAAVSPQNGVCFLSTLLGTLSWVERYWQSLEKDEFVDLRRHLSWEPHKRRQIWRELAQQPGAELRFNPAQWTMIRDGEYDCPLYIPTLPSLTDFGGHLLLMNEAKTAVGTTVGSTVGRTVGGSGWDSNARVETTVGSEEGKLSMDAYKVYCMVRSTLPEAGWESLRRITPATFDHCNLAYVEVAAAISSCFESPYGTVDGRMHDAVVEKLGSRWTRVRLRNWLTGCLLQHAQGSLSHLLEFCATVLKFVPPTSYAHPRHDGDNVTVDHAHIPATRRLECLRARPLRISEHLRRPDFGDAIRLAVWAFHIAGLPTISAREYGSMCQADLAEVIHQSGNTSQAAAAANPEEHAWIRRYWELLGPEQFQRLSDGVDSALHRRRLTWLKNAPILRVLLASEPIAPRLSTTAELSSNRTMLPTEWTMTSVLGAPEGCGGERPLYIPELGVMKTGVRCRPCFRDEYEAYYLLHQLLGDERWAKLRTIKPEDFKECAQGYIRLAAEFQRYFLSPFGILDTLLMTWISKEAKLAYRSPTLTNWISGCLLQYCQMPFHDLVQFCHNHFRMSLFASDSSSESLPAQLKATAEAMSRLPVISIAELATQRAVRIPGLRLETASLAEPKNPARNGDEEHAPKRHCSDRADDDGGNASGSSSSNDGEAWLQQVTSRWREWLESPQVQELAELPAIKYACTNYWPQLSRCMAILDNEGCETER
ncbi:hypothetical protein GNI_046390 [Gregarina niphandrodes]|uniref:Uncharacterized protein n=1 Tax=Gregarina niphandrodes TaxID=110365 RepID=A0A023B9U3_GRENI|nr:hypothetical protein GNI_046390 [Gregarina niphandrodes]EZG75435.1 hypothetical protein GNI_046390 [Gregarina niphandrodes]|eukprot:XP_011129609.1 hypothetical protein GNI_046390 [Gregarina niphandrodes]